MTSVLLLLLDAFNPSYLKHTPFLRSLYQSQLKPMVGYNCTLASIFTGLSPSQHGYFNIFTLDQKTPKWHKFFRLYNKFPSIHKILLQHGHKFSAKNQKPHPDKNIYPRPSTFDILRKKNIPFLYYNHPWWITKNTKLFLPLPYSDNLALNTLKLNYTKFQFVFFHLYDLDRIGHNQPGKTILKKFLKNLDHQVKDVVSHWNGEVIIFSDHGMHSVNEYVNLQNILQDETYFLESTMARIWNPQKTTIQKLKQIPYGRFLTSTEKQFYVPNSQHGTHFWCTHVGSMISPNFWSQSRTLAMHGHIDEPPVILLSNSKIPNKTHTPLDLFDLLRQQLSI